MQPLPISFDDILGASARINGIAHRTPVLTSAQADAGSGAKLFFKAENLQRAGAFKFRGAYNAIAQLSAAQRASGVIAVSSGNHAQGIALAAQLLGTKALIVMPTDAPAIKMAATRFYGAEIILIDRYTGDRDAIAADLAAQRGLALVHPFDNRHIMAGQGTVASEMIADAGPFDTVLVPLGGGGLLSGCAVAARALAPKCRIIGVEPEAGNDGQLSFRSGAIVRIETPKTIADGAQTQKLGSLTFAVIRDLADDIITVSDAGLVAAMLFFASRMKILVEPTGCLAAAAVFSGKIDVRGQRVGIVLSGGNVDVLGLADLARAI